MNNMNTKKITALGVVIFSFISIILCMVIIALIDAVAALLVLKTSISEGFLKAGSVIGSGIGLTVSTAFLTAKTKIKGIISAGVLAAAIIIIKIIGNGCMGMGGYLSLNGLIGILFIVIFSLVGGVVGSAIKR